MGHPLASSRAVPKALLRWIRAKALCPKSLYSYVVLGIMDSLPTRSMAVCTLATCKPRIRNGAEPGDWIIGTGSKQRGRKGHLVFVMRVSEALSFNEYWQDNRFWQKRPNLRGSKKQAFGDNIYFKDQGGRWHQEDSHHSYSDGSQNWHNVANDTRADRVLVGVEYAYWGGAGPRLPQQFRDYDGKDLCAGRGYKCRFSESLVADFVAWFQSLTADGYCGDPGDWDKTA